jgi:hypothetical protein
LRLALVLVEVMMAQTAAAALEIEAGGVMWFWVLSNMQ